MKSIFAWSLLCAIALFCVGASSAHAEDFVWDGMHSRFATDLSQTEEQCLNAGAKVPDDPFTNELARATCPGLQQMAMTAGQCDPVDFDLRGHRHDLMGLQHGGRTDTKPGAWVQLPWQPTAVICEFAKTDQFVFTAIIYVGTQPNGQPACHNVAIDIIPIRFVQETIPTTVEQVDVISQSYELPRDIYLGKCVPNIVRYIVNRGRL